MPTKPFLTRRESINASDRERTETVSKPVILIVDDEALIVRLIQVNLERAGYGVQMATNGLEAMQHLHEAAVLPDLILLDGIMPYMDGFEALTQMKADPRLQTIPVVMTSARSRNADILEGENRGAILYLAKPINPTELLAVVRELVGDPVPE
ncbi:MAG: Response regulator consisting of a CheY-like receiver domain and a winged-helix DNA-binding domain [Chthonomonadales bacterium]|nr:Response regulator consisting of a CheY-like receiver domain and a winged-helix DNA-binding domain [Chthonomonadales bacterium]